MGYKKVTKKEGMRIYSYYEETANRAFGSKGKIRKEISSKVADRDDLIADAFKLNFLIISAIKYIWYALPDDVKDNIPEEPRKLLEDSFKKYENTETIMDLYLANGDTSFIDRILERQNAITEIVKSK